MDKVANYREIVQRILLPFRSHRYANADVENEPVFDRDNDHYLIMQLGWQEGARVVSASHFH